MEETNKSSVKWSNITKEDDDILELDNSPVIDSESLEVKRGQWANKLDFLFSCISLSVGLGNVWRFPYLCYRNGGGAFLLVYFIAMIFCGVPIFFQEVAIGQYLGSGGMTLVSQLCPILKGVGISTMVIVFFLDIYYCIIIAWTIFYLVSSLSSLPGLPWEDCENPWNTNLCYHPAENVSLQASIPTNLTSSPVEEFWMYRVLRKNGGIELGFGDLNYELAICLVIAWTIVYIIIYKGLHSSGKIIWFTALFPYFVMAILLCRSLSLEGAFTGLSHFIHVDWTKLKEGKTWIDGATQIFFAYSVGVGALPALGSYNKFNHNCLKDALITCFVNTGTSLIAGILVFSILGHMAHVKEATIEEVVNSGPGLVFLTYPDLVLQLPLSYLWALIFFLMLLVLGVDSEFCNVEALITGLVDNWPTFLLKNRRALTLGVCLVMLILGLPMCTQGGIYIFQLMDFYSASGMPLLWACFFQTIAIGWVFGTDNFCDCVQEMTGKRPGLFWFMCWKYLAPTVMFFVFAFYCISYEPVRYGNDYQYPKWAEIIGIGISLSSMMWVPIYAIYYLISGPGSFTENLKSGLLPNITRNNAKRGSILHPSESGVGLLVQNSSEIEMSQLEKDKQIGT